MPTSEQFVEGFSIENGTEIYGYKIKDTSCVEHSIVQWNVYEYTIKIKLSKSSNKSIDINRYLEKFIKQVDHDQHIKIIRTDSGRPYTCYINDFSIRKKHKGDNDKIIIECTGHAKRVAEKVAKEYE